MPQLNRWGRGTVSMPWLLSQEAAHVPWWAASASPSPPSVKGQSRVAVTRWLSVAAGTRQRLGSGAGEGKEHPSESTLGMPCWGAGLVLVLLCSWVWSHSPSTCEPGL